MVQNLYYHLFPCLYDNITINFSIAIMISTRDKDLQNNTSHFFLNLWNEQNMTDVTLATEDDKQIHVHKVILCSGSTVFKNIIMNNPIQNLLIYLKDISYQYLMLIARFLYTGQCTVEESELGKFLSLGNALKVIGLPEIVNNTESNIAMEDNVINLHREKNVVTVFEDEKKSIRDVITNNNKGNIVSSQPENREFACNECEAIYRYKGSLDTNRQLLHKSVSYDCNQCKYMATKQSSLKIHMQSVHEDVIYSCNQCEYKASNQSNITTHIQVVHEGLWYDCTQCEFNTPRQSYIKMHIEKVHEGVRYGCDQCEYKATEKGHLKTHIQSVHNGIRYACCECDSTFSWRNRLKKHIKAVHNRVRI